jgi:hypothetical protein
MHAGCCWLNVSLDAYGSGGLFPTHLGADQEQLGCAKPDIVQIVETGWSGASSFTFTKSILTSSLVTNK